MEADRRRSPDPFAFLFVIAVVVAVVVGPVWCLGLLGF